MLIIKNGKIVTMANWLIDGGDILIDNGIIKDIVSDSSYEPSVYDVVINADGNFVFPGFIDVHTHCGLDGSIISDPNCKEQFISPMTSTSQYVDISGDTFEDCVKSGITSVIVSPFNYRIVGGNCCAVKTVPTVDFKPNIVSQSCGAKFSLCAMDDNDYVIDPCRIPFFLRDELSSARGYFEQELYEPPILQSPALEAYRPILLDGMSVFISVANSKQLKIAKSIIDDFSLNGIIVLQNSDKAVDLSNLSLNDKKTPLVLNPILIGTCERKELAKFVADEDIDIAVSTSYPNTSLDILPINAGIFVRDGLQMETALKAITTTPAKMCNLSDKIGSIEVGKDADIVILDGNPLEVLSSVLCTIIDGRVVYNAQMD